jgi:hypothetical protein
MFIQTVFRVELDLQDVHTAVLLRVEDSFGAGISQTHAVLILLVLHHRKVALNSGCTGKNGRQTTDESHQQRIRVLETDPSITIRSAVCRSCQWSSSHRVGGGTGRTKPCADAQ